MLLFRYSLLFVVVALVGTSCKAPSVLSEQPALQPLPSTFSSSADTMQSSGTLPWKEFFKDPHLVALIEQGIMSNLDLKIAMQRIEVSRTYVRISKAAFLPTLTAAASVGQRKFGEYTMDGIGNFDTNFSQSLPADKRVPEHLPDYFTGVQSTWEIDLWGKLRNQKKAALARFLATEKGRQLVITTLVSDIARSYYELIALDNELQIVQQNITLQQTAVDLIHAQKTAGRATELAVKQFTAQLLHTKSMEAQLKQLIVQNENQINFLLGRFSEPIQRGNPILQQPLPDEIKTGVPSTWLSRRPDIVQAELNLQSARFNVGALRAAFYPSLTITSALGLQSFRPEKFLNAPGAIAYTFLGGLTAPLFNKAMIRADYQRASAEQMEMIYDYQKILINGYLETVTGLQRIDNLKTAATFKQEEVDILQEGVSTANDLYVAGLASYLEVILAQKNVLEAEIQLAETRKEQFFAVIDLYRALGGGWQ